MSLSHDERQRELLDIDVHQEQISPLSNRFLVAHSSPVHEPANTDIPSRLPDDSFQSSSSTSNSKSSSSTHSHTSRFQHLMMQHHHQHHSAVNSPLAYSRCTSLGSLSSFDIRSSYNDSYTSECSSIKPSGMISPSDIPDSPPCEPEILEDDEYRQQQQQQMKPNNRTLTMNTTSSLNRTTMMGETVIEKTFIFNQQEFISHHKSENIQEEQEDDNDGDDDDEHLDEVIVYTYEIPEMNSNEILFDDDSYRVFTSQTDEHDRSIEEQKHDESSFNVPSHENLSVITEESSFIEELHSNDENNSIKILYDLIKKPHWTNKTSVIKPSHYSTKKFHPMEENASFSSNPSSLSFDSHDGMGTDDEEEYDQEKGRQLIQRLIEETLARRSLPTDFLHSTSCMHCPSNTPMTTETRSISSSSSSSSSSSTSTKSCTCITHRSNNITRQPQRSQSSPARPSSIIPDDSKRPMNKQKENLVHHTRSSFLRLRQAQQNKRLNQQDKRC